MTRPYRHPDVSWATLIPIILLLSVLFVPSVHAQIQGCKARISDFEFIGNKVTLGSNLIRWSGLAMGESVSNDDLQDARQRLLDTRLYKQVEIHAEDICSEQTRITIRLEEKRYHLVYPRLRRSGDGDITRGLIYQGNNLFGSDHSIKLEATRRDYADGNSADHFKFEYDQPLAFKPYLLRWQAHTVDTVLADTQELVIETDDFFSFLVGRDWHSDVFDVPVSIYVKIGLQTRSLQDPLNESEQLPGNFNTLGLRFEYDDVHQEKYRRYGKFLATEINRGMEGIGTDFDTTELHLIARFYHRLNPLDNFNSQFRVSLASSTTFGTDNFSLGGADTLRGLEKNLIEGNSLWQANLEYIKGFQRWRNFRVSLFTDIGNVFEDVHTFNGEDWTVTYGAGLRWKIQTFVDTDLVIDYGRNPDTGFSRIYASTSVVF